MHGNTYRYLRQPMAEGLPLRVVAAYTDDPDEIVEGNPTPTENNFNPDFKLVGRVIRLEKNELELVFERMGVPPETTEADRCAVG